MDANDTDDPTAEAEMSTAEAAGYLSGLVGYSVSAEVLDSLSALGRGPVAENQGQSLRYRRSALDAFLRENGTDPMACAVVPGRTRRCTPPAPAVVRYSSAKGLSVRPKPCIPAMHGSFFISWSL